MKPSSKAVRDFLRVMLLGGAIGCTGTIAALAGPAKPAMDEIRIIQIEGGTVDVIPAGAANAKGVPTSTTNQVLHPGDRLRTGPNTRIALRWPDDTVVRFGASTELEIVSPNGQGASPGLHFIEGILSFFHRGKPGRIQIISRPAIAGVLGTEFIMALEMVNNKERATLYVVDGQVQFTNEQGSVVVTNGRKAIADFGAKPVVTAGFIANNILQWCSYYPAVLDLGDLPLTPGEQQALADSLAAYRQGDLLAALSKYPARRQPGTDAERIYQAALLLSVGHVDQTETILAGLPVRVPSERLPRLATALRQLIAAVKHQANPSTLKPQLASEFLAASYVEQSDGVREDSLRAALALAKQAATNSPNFGFAWERVAELEFSFGRTRNAMDALDKSIALAPRNAQALALKGFLLAAQNRTRQAIDQFNDAIAADSGLGNAWLGRGLCRIRRGDLVGGREDLLVAAALEPQRAALRSYLAKAYTDAGDSKRARHELDLAKGLDPADPTAWLYSALLDQQYNRINQGIRDLEKSQKLNENRRVYRSKLLLDQDQAVRSANLATLYRDAGMFDVSVREASRAVSYDYANYSGHLFLANSYNALRDLKKINSRYETPTVTEYLLANLLAPVGAGTLSPTISQQEYSKLFVRDRFGLSSSTEYLSRGTWSQESAQYGTFGNFSYDLEAIYSSDHGERKNDDLELRQLSLAVKQQLTSQDSVYLQVLEYEAKGGDRFQYFDPATANPGFRTHEKADPELTLGYHHQWGPGVHTLFLAGYMVEPYSARDPNETVVIAPSFGGAISGVRLFHVLQDFSLAQDLYSTELQQIWQEAAHNTTIFGGRFQSGDFRMQNIQTHPSDFGGLFKDPSTPSSQHLKAAFQRYGLYGYHHWQVAEPLLLIGGLSYDRLSYPENFLIGPLSRREKAIDQVSPKAGLIWRPAASSTIRAGYTRSLSGVSLDQNFRLEPSEVAGFNQAFRSIIPESAAGGNPGARFETYGISLEQKFDPGTYLGLSGEFLNAKVHRTFGSFRTDDTSDFAFPSGLREHLDFRERSVIFTADQLVGNGFSLGARYRLTQAKLADNFVDVPDLPPDAVDLPFRARQHLESLLHQLDLHAIYNHPSGLFTLVETSWYLQSNEGYAPSRPGDNFWQHNVFVGYRFPRRQAELSVGLLNVMDQGYRLNPLTLYNELPHKRTLVTRLRFNF